MKFTKSEIEARGLLLIEGTSIDDNLFMSGDTWTYPCVATLDQWSDAIPECQVQARSTEYHDWYSDQSKYESWDSYRDYLMSQLRPIDILPDEQNSEQVKRISFRR
jgi:hypothetical protein